MAGKSGNDPVRSRAAEASVLDAIVVSILGKRPSPRTSVQKLGLLVKAIVDRRLPDEFVSYYYGGFSEEVTETLAGLVEEGFARRVPRGAFALTSDGDSLSKAIGTDRKLGGGIVAVSHEIIEFVASLDDGEVVSLMYGLFPELTTESRIKDDVEARPLPSRVKITKVNLR